MSEITVNILTFNWLCEMILQFILFLFITLYGYKISIVRKIKDFNSLKISAFMSIIVSDMVIALYGQFTLNSQIIFYVILIISILCKFYGYFLIAIILKKLFSFILTTRVNQPNLSECPKLTAKAQPSSLKAMPRQEGREEIDSFTDPYLS